MTPERPHGGGGCSAFLMIIGITGNRMAKNFPKKRRVQFTRRIYRLSLKLPQIIIRRGSESSNE